MQKIITSLMGTLVAFSGVTASAMEADYHAQPQQTVSFIPNKAKKVTETSTHRLPKRVGSADEIISSVEGKQEDISISGSGIYFAYGILAVPFENEVSATHMVYGENDEVYIYNMIVNAPTNSYVKGILKDGKLTINLPQTVMWDEASNDGYSLTLLAREQVQQIDWYGNPIFDKEGNPVMEDTYAQIEGDKSVTFTLGSDDVLSTEQVNEDVMLGYAYCNSGNWAKYGMTAIEINLGVEGLITPPEDAEIIKDKWTIKFSNYGWPINYVENGKEVYFQGLCQGMPDAWVKGTTSELFGMTLVTLPQDQYLGIYYDYFVYTKCAKISENEDGEVKYTLLPDHEYQLYWDKYSNTMIPLDDDDIAFVFNAAQDRVYYVDMISGFELATQDSYEGTPTNPENLQYDIKRDQLGYDNFIFDVPNLSTEGNVLLPENLYYVMYVDGMEWEFGDTGLIEVPWNYEDFSIYDDGTATRKVRMKVEGVTTLGVQSVYYYEGKEYLSDIVTLDLGQSGVKQTETGKMVAEETYYDLNGRKVKLPTNGIFVRQTTYSDGTSSSTKCVIR